MRSPTASAGSGSSSSTCRSASAALAITQLKLRESRDPDADRIDWGGLVTFSTSLFLLVLALLRGNDEGWGSSLIVGLLVGAALLMAAFIVVERSVEQPMLPLDLFRRRAFTGVQLAAFALSGSMFAMFLYLTLFMQGFLGLDAARGRRALPADHGHLLPRRAGRGRAAEQACRRGYMLGIGLTMTGVGLLLMGGLSGGSEWTTLLPGFLVGRLRASGC